MPEMVPIESSVVENDLASEEVAYKIFSLIVDKDTRRVRFLLDTKRSFDLADQYFDPGRGTLSNKGKEHTKYIFDQILETYANILTVSEMLDVLKQTYKLASKNTQDPQENKTLQLLIASLRGHVLLHRDSFKTKQERHQLTERQSVLPVPRMIRQVVRTALLGIVLFGFGHTQEVSHSEENKPGATSIATP